MAAPSCEEPGPASKKRKREGPDTGKGVFVQSSPFKPSGKFKTCQTLDTSYFVKPSKRWTNMTRYNSFVRKLTLYKLIILHIDLVLILYA